MNFYKHMWFIILMLIVFASVGTACRIDSIASSMTNKPIAQKTSTSYVIINTTSPSQTSAASHKPNSKTTVSITELAKNRNAMVGELGNIYRVNTKYTNDDGSYIVINFENIKRQTSFTANNGRNVADVVVIENVPPIDITRNFISQVAFFQAFDKYGEELMVGDIYTQSGKDLSEIIIHVNNVKLCSFLLVGGFDKTKYGSELLLFPVK